MTADETEVRALYGELVAGWNDGNGARFAAPFTEDGDLVAFDGTRFSSRSDIARFHQALFDKWMKGTRLTGTVTDVQFPTADLAVIHAVGGTIRRRRSKPARARDSIQTLVAVRVGGSWMLQAFHNTRIRPIGSSFGAVVHWAIGDRLWALFRLSTDPSPANTASAQRSMTTGNR